MTEASTFGNMADFTMNVIDATSGEMERIAPNQTLPISPGDLDQLGSRVALLPGGVAARGRGQPLLQRGGAGSGQRRGADALLDPQPARESRLRLLGAGNHGAPAAAVQPDGRPAESAARLPSTPAPGKGRPSPAAAAVTDSLPTLRTGHGIIFSSNRSGNLDLWTLDVRTGAVHQITDDEAVDWDPDFTPDGKSIVWSSNRGGSLEIWMADVDGARARQISNDGLDAENPTATADGKYIIYWSANPEKQGVWRARTDGTEQTRLLEGVLAQPEVSPDGRWATYLDPTGLAQGVSTIRVVEVETGEVVPFAIEVEYERGLNLVFGRMRWLPDGSGIVFVGEDEDGLSGLYAQDFEPGKDTRASRRAIAGFSREWETESFDMSPDGRHVMISAQSEIHSLMLADNVPGL